MAARGQRRFSKRLSRTGFGRVRLFGNAENDTSADAPGRIENLKELVGVMSDTENYPNLAEFLEHVSLVMDNDNAVDNNKVMLITLHSAKGLEFNIVFLPGWEEGLFPHQKALMKAEPTRWKKNVASPMWLLRAPNKNSISPPLIAAAYMDNGKTMCRRAF